MDIQTTRRPCAPQAAPVAIAGVLVAVLAAWPSRTGVSPSMAAAPSLAAPGASALQRASQSFVPNMGQWDAQVQFLARAPGVSAWVTDRGVVYDFHRFELAPPKMDPFSSKPKVEGRRTGHVVRMEFLGGKSSSVVGEQRLEGVFNYFLGSDRSRWASNVPRYAEARSEHVYDGVEARWYFDQGRLRYDLNVAPGADPGKIQMRFEGADRLAARGKTLSIGTSLGEVPQAELFAYQRVAGSIQQVPCSFVVRGKVASFAVGVYDRDRPLVIDPLLWSTTFGESTYTDIGYSVTLDPAMKPIVTGTTGGELFPTTAGAYDTTYSSSEDIFVAKLSANGSSLEFGTYLGGSYIDTPCGVKVDNNGNVFVAGVTRSSDFPATVGAFDTVMSNVDGFVAKFNSTCSFLLYSTFIGGFGTEYLNGLAVTADGQAIVGGGTLSLDFPTTPNDYDLTPNGEIDAFVAKLTADGSALVYGTYFGGAGLDLANDLALAPNGDAVIAGRTESSDMPTTGGAYDSSYNLNLDGFIARISPDGSTLVGSTYLGSGGNESAFGVATSAAGDVFVGLNADSSGCPTSASSYQPANAGAWDLYLAHLAPGLTQMVGSTYLGGGGDDQMGGIVVDSTGDLMVAAYGTSNNFPTTSGGASSVPGGSHDAFVCRLGSNLSDLRFSTYLGGDNVDTSSGLVQDANHNTVVTGFTVSTNFPLTVGAFSTNLGGGDAYVSLVATAPVLKNASLPNNTAVGGFSVPLNLTLNQPALLGDTFVSLSTDSPGKVFLPATTKVKAGKTSKTLGVRTETVKVNTPIHVTATCNGVSKTLSLTLKPGGLLSVKLNPTTLSAFQLGSGTVTLSAPAPASARRVDLDSSKSSSLYVPSTVDVEPGDTSAVFPTFAGPISVSENLTVAARLGTMRKTANITVNP